MGTITARACACLAAAALAVALSACAPATTADSVARPSGSARAAAASAAPDPAPTASAAPHSPVAKVKRPGAVSTPTVTAAPATTSTPVRYRDGVTLSIAKVDFRTETAQGPGSFPGREYARLSLRLTNDTRRALDLSSTVVTVVGRDGTRAAPVYALDADARDFGGAVAAGRSADAIYAFAVPAADRSRVTVVVDFDAAHSSAVFTGPLR